MRKIALALAVASLSLSAPAHAQSQFWAGVTADAVGQAVRGSTGPGFVDDTRCMEGRARVSQRAARRLQASAQSTMNGYILISSRNDAADVTPVYVTPDKPGPLTLDSEAADPLAFVDPIADAFLGLRNAGEPEQFVPGGDGQSGAGIWPVRDANGAVLGYYRGVFVAQQRDVLRLSSLEVRTGAVAPELFTPFCHAPGDIEERQAEIAEKAEERAAEAAQATPEANAEQASSVEPARPAASPPETP